VSFPSPCERIVRCSNFSYTNSPLYIVIGKCVNHNPYEFSLPDCIVQTRVSAMHSCTRFLEISGEFCGNRTHQRPSRLRIFVFFPLRNTFDHGMHVPNSLHVCFAHSLKQGRRRIVFPLIPSTRHSEQLRQGIDYPSCCRRPRPVRGLRVGQTLLQSQVRQLQWAPWHIYVLGKRIEHVDIRSEPNGMIIDTRHNEVLGGARNFEKIKSQH
jgi:hypothetical protein